MHIFGSRNQNDVDWFLSTPCFKFTRKMKQYSKKSATQIISNFLLQRLIFKVGHLRLLEKKSRLAGVFFPPQKLMPFRRAGLCSSIRFSCQKRLYNQQLWNLFTSADGYQQSHNLPKLWKSWATGQNLSNQVSPTSNLYCPKWGFEPAEEVLLTPIAKWSKIVGNLSGKWKKVSKNNEPNRETESGVV